ncbi:MAG TPA: amino acid adenylation domain-containing protein, partial [Herpetosiphonaceae bacterium]
DQWDPGNTVYNVPFATRITGPLRVAAFERSLNEIIRRHEALRTTFVAIDGHPRQIVAPTLTISLPLIDLRDCSPADQTAEVQRRIAESAQHRFDLARGPLLRADLLRLHPEGTRQEYVFLLNVHHIVFDAWSVGLFLRELTVLYDAVVTDRPLPLPALAIQYPDFAIWQRQWLQGAVLDEQFTYWKHQLRGHLPVIELPSDHLRPHMLTYQGALDYHLIPATVAQQVQALSQAEGSTLFMTLFAAFQILLYRYTGEADITTGSPIANRDFIDIEPLMGFFLNTLLLRTNLAGNPTFRAFLRQVRETTLEAYAHQNVPFEQLVEELRPPRDTSHAPLFQMLFILQNAPVPAHGQRDLTVEYLRVDNGTSKHDLTLSLTEMPEGLRAVAEYMTDLFEPTTIKRLLGHYEQLLESIVADPDCPVSALQMLTKAERRRLVVDWNATQVDLPELCLHNLFEAQVARTPDATAVVCEEQTLTYQQLNQQANRLAHSLIQRGVGPDCVVALYAERSITFLVAILAIFKAGGAYLPLDPLYPPNRLSQILSQSGTTLALVTRPLAEAFLQAIDSLAAQRRPLALMIEELLHDDEPADNVPPRATARNLAYVIYTSGSTGVPKGAMVEHRGMLNHALAKVADLRLSAADRIAQTASQSFDISVWQFVSALLVGGQVHIFPDMVTHDPVQLLAEAERRSISILEIVPSLLRALLDELAQDEGQRPGLSALRWLLLTGEALPPNLCRQWLDRYPSIPLLNAYGPTECSDDVTHHIILTPPPADAVQVPIGRPIANTRLYIVDERLEPVPIGVPGQLCVGGMGVGRGYLDDPARTADVFVPDPFSQNGSAQGGARLYRTGDLARYRADGTIEFLGRLDHQVKVRGFRIELGEIEAALLQHEAVREAVVVAREDDGHTRLVAYVTEENREPRTESQGDEPDGSRFLVPGSSLRAFLASRLPEYMVPSLFVPLDALPLTPNGKVDRRALPAPDHQRRELGGVFVAPHTATEQQVAALWLGVLKLDQVGLHDNFFELGGHSLLATQLIAQLRSAFQVDLPIRHLFASPTVAGVASVIDRMRWLAQPSAVLAAVNEPMEEGEL